MRCCSFSGSIVVRGGAWLLFAGLRRQLPNRSPAASTLPEPLPVVEKGTLRTEVVEALKSGTISNPQNFEDYFKKYELPRMTSHALRPESDNPGKEDLPAYRK